MKIRLLYIAIGLIIISCSASKTKTSKKTDRLINETETVKSTRAGDTLTYTVLNPILKDTVIYVKDTQKVGSNTLRIAYDSSGKQTIDCISDEINELKETIRSISEQEKLDTKEKESILNGSFLFYIFLGLTGLLIVNKIANKFL